MSPLRTPSSPSTQASRTTTARLVREALTSARPGRRRAAQRQRGAALVISLFTLLVITGLGLLAVQTASEEVQASGNHRFNHQGHRTSAGALDVALANVAANGPAIWDFMKRNAQRAADEADSSVVDVPAMYTFDDATLKTQFFIDAGGDATALSPSMSVVMRDPLDGFSVAGYSTDFCFKRFTFEARATVGAPPVNLDFLDARVRYSEATHRATGLLGPIECEGN